METGILFSPSGELNKSINYYQHCVDHLCPEYAWFSDSMMRDTVTQLSGYPKMPAEIDSGNLIDPVVSIAAMYCQSKHRPEIGIAVTDFIKHAPPTIARSSYSLRQLIGKNFHIGFGLGGVRNLQPLGYDLSKRSIDNFERNMDEFSRINTSGIFDSEQHGEIKLGYNSPNSKIWIGGQHKNILPAVARFADGWMPAVKMEPVVYSDKINTINNLSTLYGRQAPTAGMYASLIMGQSKDSVFKLIEENPILKVRAFYVPVKYWERYGVKPSLVHINIGKTLLKNLPADELYSVLMTLPAQLLDSLYYIGNAEEIAAELHPFRQLGLKHLALTLQNDIDYIKQDSDIAFQEFSKLFREVKSW